MAHETTIRQKVFNLRKEGYSYSYISQKIGISKSTLSGWLSNISYKPNQKTIEKIGKARAASGLVKAKQKLQSFKDAQEEAKAEIGQVTKRDLFMLGLGIYIGEGAKTHDIIRISNSDPRIIKFGVKWFKNIYGLQTENFTIRIHIYPDNDLDSCLEFWSKAVNLPTSNFKKAYIDKRENKKKIKTGKLPFGTAHLTVKSNGEKKFGVLLARKINALMDEVLL